MEAALAMIGAVVQWRLLKLVLGYGLAIAAVYFTAIRFGVSAADVWDAFLGPRGTEVVSALLLFTLHGALNAFAFGYLVRAFGGEVRLTASAAAWGGSVLAKYVPGGVWQVIGRGAMLRRHGVGADVSLWTSLLEQVISLLACISVVLFAVSLGGDGVRYPGMVTGAAVVLLVLCLPLLVPDRVGLSRKSWFLVAALMYGAALVPYALGYVLLVSPSDPTVFVGRLFEGTVAGLVAFFAPGGVGVRESWVVVSQPVEGDTRLLGILILARALILLSEVFLTLVSIAFGRQRLIRRRSAA